MLTTGGTLAMVGGRYRSAMVTSCCRWRQVSLDSTRPIMVVDFRLRGNDRTEYVLRVSSKLAPTRVPPGYAEGRSPFAGSPRVSLVSMFILPP
jgi:uncharacterized membrane protein